TGAPKRSWPDWRAPESERASGRDWILVDPRTPVPSVVLDRSTSSRHRGLAVLAFQHLTKVPMWYTVCFSGRVMFSRAFSLVTLLAIAAGASAIGACGERSGKVDESFNTEVEACL